MLGAGVGCVGFLGVRVHALLPLLGNANAHQQDVASLKRDVALLRNLKYVAELDLML